MPKLINEAEYSISICSIECMCFWWNNISVCEDVCNQPNVFEANMNLASRILSPSDMKTFISQPDKVLALEMRVKIWMKKLQGVRR